jgi:hypothetical protein
MTVSELIEEIKRLSPEDQTAVIRFAYELDAARKLSGDELSTLAERMVKSESNADKMMLRDAIIRGFYGNENHA